MMLNTTIPTAKTIKANRPDICLRNRKTKTCLLIDISCPANGNIGRKHDEKLAKYSDLQRGDKLHGALSNTGGSSGLRSFGHSARRYCTVAGHYSKSSQPAALTENSASGIYSDPS